MTWIIVIVSLFVFLVLAEEIINFFLRTRVINHHTKTERSDRKLKSMYNKVKLKITHSLLSDRT
ncbi:MAG: hypothetical protein ACQET6_03810 [Bacillota bacterium]|uniref:hypothetical protein n=1 Tax=Rossellomorea sp. FM04394 TaxID=3243076 RepID=UPI0035A5A7F8